MLKNRVLWLFLTVICCFNVFGQQREVTPLQFYQAEAEALKKVDGFNQRITYKTEYFNTSDGSSQNSYTLISEKIFPDKTRSLLIHTSGNVTKKKEEIRIGYFLYQRIDDGKWTKTDLRKGNGAGYGNGVGDGDGDGSRNIKITNKFTAVESDLNGQGVTLYEKLTTVEYTNLYTTFSSEKFWINKEGLILKKESKSGYLNPEKIGFQNTTEYEYNPKDLKIEAPIK